MTHSIHKEGDILQIYFCVIFRETRRHSQAHVTSGALCPFFGREKNTRQRSRVRWPVFVMVTSAEACCCCCLLLYLFFLFFLKLVFNIASAPNSDAVSATRISMMASSSSFIFFPAMALRLTIVCLVYTICDWPELQKH